VDLICVVKDGLGAPLVGAQNKPQHISGQPQGIAPTVGDIVGEIKEVRLD